MVRACALTETELGPAGTKDDRFAPKTDVLGVEIDVRKARAPARAVGSNPEVSTFSLERRPHELSISIGGRACRDLSCYRRCGGREGSLAVVE
jgi:hypothetical protein